MALERHREILDYDPETETYRTTYGYPSKPPSIAVPTALAELTEVTVTDFEPMYHAGNVDPDALDDMFCPSTGSGSPEASVTFTYHGYEITVKSYGRIVLRELERDGRRPPD